MPDNWCLIFSDGTGQRGVRNDAGVRNTNVFQMFAAAEGKIYLDAFYDPGLGAPEEGENDWGRTLRNLWSKATGWGISANIADCYEALMLRWKPGVKIGLFGFSRGAYTVRCLGGVLATCGIAMTDGGISVPTDKEGEGARRRRAIAEAAVSAYKIRSDGERKAAGQAFARKYGAAPAMPDVIGVFDTVKALGLPGVMDLVNPWRHQFHDNELSTRVPVGLQALSIDEDRKAFLPVPWADMDAEGRAAGQVIEQVWFPGVHSDVGGGYQDDARQRARPPARRTHRLRHLLAASRAQRPRRKRRHRSALQQHRGPLRALYTALSASPAQAPSPCEAVLSLVTCYRWPKMAEPTRTEVAPKATAVS
ncbi:MAG: DUF2235 domain-containing protein [Mesorhizobium sp.]|nr:DUF2235 domain-containing protein [Mesorhizobium sp.]MBN9241932.1 DUF2235 domain-containing protein [Mesorhizobium sp.]